MFHFEMPIYAKTILLGFIISVLIIVENIVASAAQTIDYVEPPVLKPLVKDGTLPPIIDRLPAKPRIINMVDINRDNIIKDICNFTKRRNVLAEQEELKPYETDGLTAYKQTPMLVVLPETTQEVSKILSYCNKKKIKVVPRGAGTGLAGSALPLADCVLLGLGKFNKILEKDYKNRCVVAQPGVTNLAITQAVQDLSLIHI